jgi:hypothetical protein
MLHTCVERFDVIGGRENILGWDGKWTRPKYRPFHLLVYLSDLYPALDVNLKHIWRWRPYVGRKFSGNRYFLISSLLYSIDMFILSGSYIHKSSNEVDLQRPTRQQEHLHASWKTTGKPGLQASNGPVCKLKSNARLQIEIIKWL